jgi:transposase
VVGLDATGRVTTRRRMRRESIVALAAKLPGCVIAMEACCGAHHLGRQLAARGHEVRLMSPEYVRPYVKAQKNDDRDAEAIAEAATRPTMRFVALKTEAQLDVQVLHRVRDRLVGQRTALMNQMRSILLERGTVVPQGRRKLLDALDRLLGAEDIGVGPRVRLLLADMLDQWRGLDRRITALDDEFAEMPVRGSGAAGDAAAVLPRSRRPRAIALFRRVAGVSSRGAGDRRRAPPHRRAPLGFSSRLATQSTPGSSTRGRAGPQGSLAFLCGLCRLARLARSGRRVKLVRRFRTSTIRDLLAILIDGRGGRVQLTAGIGKNGAVLHALFARRIIRRIAGRA